MQAIIELTGKPGAGKTTLANILGEELTPASVLFIDASLDQKLTLTLAPEPPQLTLGRLFGQRTEATGSREAIDWAFHDLTVGVGEENELLTVGNLPEEISIADKDKLRYGLNRLAKTYDYVVIDGYHPLLRQLLPEEQIRTVEIVTPKEFADWQPPQEGEVLYAPTLILNRYQDETLPPMLDNALSQRQIRLIGKVPSYATAEDRIRRLPDDFKNCLLKLDIPMNLSSP